MKCWRCDGDGHLVKNCKSKKNTKDIKCFSCGKTGHFAANCPTKGNASKRCNICRKINHLEKDCYFRNKENKGAN